MPTEKSTCVALKYICQQEIAAEWSLLAFIDKILFSLNFDNFLKPSAISFKSSCQALVFREKEIYNCLKDIAKGEKIYHVVHLKPKSNRPGAVNKNGLATNKKLVAMS